MKEHFVKGLSVMIGVFLAMTAFSFFDKFVLSHVHASLENLIEGEE